MDVFWACVLFTTSILVSLCDGVQYCAPETHQGNPTLKYLKKSDAYDVTWQRHVNSPAKLSQALSGEKMMLIGDVSMHNNEPVMKHPSETYSNLTLKKFLQQALNSSKGIKLNFYDNGTVLPALTILQNASSGKDNPIWLHAGVLPPVACTQGCSQPLTAPVFINHCKQYAPKAVISLGWATGNVAANTAGYSWKNALQMAKLVYDINQPSVIQVRAALIKKPLAQLLSLMDISPNITLTVWMAENDALDTKDLLGLRNLTLISSKAKARVYYDIPSVHAVAFKTAFEKAKAMNSEGGGGEKWRSYYASKCKDVLVGERLIMFSGDGGWVSSVADYTVKGRESRHFSIEVSFIAIDTSNPKQNFTVFVGNNGLSGNNAVVRSALSLGLTLHNSGAFSIVHPNGDATKSSKNITDPKKQYTISIFYHANQEYITFQVASKANYLTNEEIRLNELEFDKHHAIMGSEGVGGGAILAKFSSAVAVPSTSGNDNSHRVGIASFALTLILLICVFK